MRMERIVLWRMKKNRDKRLSWCQVPVPAPTLWKTQVDELLKARCGLEPVCQGWSTEHRDARAGAPSILPGLAPLVSRLSCQECSVRAGGKRRIPARGLSASVALCHSLGTGHGPCGSQPGWPGLFGSGLPDGV